MVRQVFVRKDFDPSSVMLLDPSHVRVVTLGSEEFLQLETARRGKKRLMYTCRSGDTLAKLGRRYGLTPGDLARINRFSYNTELHEGDHIVVYSPTGEPIHEVTRGMTPGERRPERKLAVSASSHGATEGPARKPAASARGVESADAKKKGRVAEASKPAKAAPAKPAHPAPAKKK
jgi:LysM repeat protein